MIQISPDILELTTQCYHLLQWGGTIDYSLMDSHGPYSFHISGQNYHHIGSLLPTQGRKSRFAQLYIYDTHDEVRN